MKSRSEALRSRSDVKKKSAAERTPNMFEKKDEPKTEVREKKETSSDVVTCEACEAETPIAKLEKDGDKFRCPECAGVIKLDGAKPSKKEEKKTPPKEEPTDDTDAGDDEEESESAEDVPASEKKTKGPKDGETAGYCGECGSAWPFMDGKPWPNCGHKKAIRVDDPRKATNMKKLTPSGVTVPPQGPIEVHVQPTSSQPTISISGNRLSVGWGKVIFPVGEPRGFKFSNMEVAQQIITVELPEGADRVKAAREILAELQQIADLAFDTQFAWYKQKLGLLDK